ncbi:MAG: ABC transporter permease, partial [Deltaproteobacteria bacterium]
MRIILKFLRLTIRTLIRDRIFLVISSLSILFLSIPVFSSFSMRQSQEVGITMCLTINSFLLLLLSIFSGVSTTWRDIEKRSVYTFLSYPISRSEYLIGRFLGCILLLFIISAIDMAVSIPIIKICARMYKSDLSIAWTNIFLAYLLIFLKYTLLTSISFLIISFATSFFTPFFLTIACYIGGNSIQSIFDYISKEASKNYPFWFKGIIKCIYYIFPNLSSFDLIPY